jgi:hypothetical protein
VWTLCYFGYYDFSFADLNDVDVADYSIERSLFDLFLLNVARVTLLNAVFVVYRNIALNTAVKFIRFTTWTLFCFGVIVVCKFTVFDEWSSSSRSLLVSAATILSCGEFGARSY